MGSYPINCVEKFLSLALNCSKDAPNERPNMVEVVGELDSIWSMMAESDGKGFEDPTSDDFETVSSSEPSSTTKYPTPSFSGDVSGSYLVSGDIPIIRPR